MVPMVSIVVSGVEERGERTRDSIDPRDTTAV